MLSVGPVVRGYKCMALSISFKIEVLGSHSYARWGIEDEEVTYAWLNEVMNDDEYC
jgi:hypothetical protein